MYEGNFIEYPRAKGTITFEAINQYEADDYWLQVKRHGTSNEIFRSPEGDLFAKNRHNQAHAFWRFDSASAAPFNKLPRGRWYVFVAELMHAKVKGIRNTNYLHDILVDGERLYGETYFDRYARLVSLFKVAKVEEYELRIDANTSIAKNFMPGSGFQNIFSGLIEPENEGIVLKNPHARLMPGNKEAWSVKHRRATGSYSR